MEKKLQIYTPKNSFEIDKTTLIVLALWTIAFLFYFAKSIFLKYEENLDLWGMLFIIIAFLYSLYFMISNSFKCEVANGEYNGYLVIDSEKITCNLDVYSIYEIKKIGILSDYFRGKFNGNTLAWERKKSNGVKNYIEIYKNNGEYQKYFFLQTKSENIEMFISELEIYYKRGILGVQNFENIANQKHYR